MFRLQKWVSVRVVIVLVLRTFSTFTSTLIATLTAELSKAVTEEYTQREKEKATYRHYVLLAY